MAAVNTRPIKGEEGLFEVVLDNPKVNALSTRVMAQLAATFEGLSENEDVRGILLRAEGGCFSAGLDLKEVIEQDRSGLVHLLGVCDRAFLAVFACPRPVAIPVSGHAVAGGLVLALCGDYVALAAGEQKLGLTELAVGIPFPRAALEVVRNALPPGGIRRLVLQPDLVDAQTAFDLGVGDDLTEKPDEAALAWLRRAASLPAAAFGIGKQQVREPALESMQLATTSERDQTVNTILSPATQQALARTLKH